MDTVWLHGRAVTSGAVVAEAMVQVVGDRIDGVWDLNREAGPPDFRALQAEGRLPAGGGTVRLPNGGQAEYYPAPEGYICPGFIDLHVHGGGGAEFMDATPAAAEAVCAFHSTHGTTALLATTWTAAPAEVCAAIAAVRSARCWAGRGPTAAPAGYAGAQVLGVHVEGPFISPRYCGAQDARLMRPPDAGEVGRWLAAGGEAGRADGASGAVWLVTMAPELPGAPELIRRLAGQGVLVNAGHTACTYAELAVGVAAGVSGITHTFNAMRPLHHREPGCVGGALTLNGLSCELIADALHVHHAAMALLVQARGPDAVVLVTDGVRAAGLPDGEYDLGGIRVQLASGAVRQVDGGALAGSALTMDRAVGNLVTLVGVPVPAAVAMATLNPARRVGMADRKGRLAPGADADVTVLDAHWRARLTMVAGRVVYRAAGDPDCVPS